MPYGLCDVDFQSGQNFNSTRVVMFFSNEHCIKLKVGLSVGTNNSTLFVAQGLLLKCVLDMNIAKFQIFGDSSLEIN
jgi:hypothetical protein